MRLDSWLMIGQCFCQTTLNPEIVHCWINLILPTEKDQISAACLIKYIYSLNYTAMNSLWRGLNRIPRGLNRVSRGWNRVLLITWVQTGYCEAHGRMASPPLFKLSFNVIPDAVTKCRLLNNQSQILNFWSTRTWFYTNSNLF